MSVKFIRVRDKQWSDGTIGDIYIDKFGRITTVPSRGIQFDNDKTVVEIKVGNKSYSPRELLDHPSSLKEGIAKLVVEPYYVNVEGYEIWGPKSGVLKAEVVARVR